MPFFYNYSLSCYCYFLLDVSVGFKGDSYMQYKPLSALKTTADIQMAFRPISRSGVMLSNKASGRNNNNDYIFIVLKRGRVIFRYVSTLLYILCHYSAFGLVG